MAAGVMTVDDLAAYLRVHKSTIYRLLKYDNFPAFKIGSDWRFIKSSVDEWMIKAVEGQVNGAPPLPKRRRAAQ